MDISLKTAQQVLSNATESEVMELSEGDLCITWCNGEYKLMSYSEELEHVLFSGDQSWLDVHVPPEDRNGDALRKYIAAYLAEMYKYIVEDW